MKAIFIIGTSHEAYQVRPHDGPQDGANAFKEYVRQAVRAYEAKSIAEEMSTEGLKGRCTVCGEVASEEKLFHILCDPTCSERQALGISKESTQSDDRKREREWLRRLTRSCGYPVLFVCGVNHVSSFKQLCQNEELVPTIVTCDFEAPQIPLDRRIL